MKEDNDMLAYFHATLNGDSIFDQPNRIVEAKAIFGQATYALNDDLFLTVGGRYTEEKNQIKVVRTGNVQYGTAVIQVQKFGAIELNGCLNSMLWRLTSMSLADNMPV